MAKLISTAELLFNTITFNELTVRQYRQMLKCFLGDEIYPELIFNNVNNILNELTSLTITEINNLNFLDYCLILIYIRQTSIGSSIFLYTENDKHEQVKIDLQLNDVIKLLKHDELFNLLQPETIDECTIEYRLPTIEEIILLEKQNDVYSVYTFFLKTIKFSTTTINLENYSFLEKENIVQKLPIKIMSILTKRSHLLINFCNNINLLQDVNNSIFNKKLPLTLNTQIIAYIIKLLYNTSLESIYEYMFVLSKAANFSCSFLDECSPGEFYYFTKKLEEVSAKQQLEQNQNKNNSDILPPINSDFDLDQ